MIRKLNEQTDNSERSLIKTRRNRVPKPILYGVYVEYSIEDAVAIYSDSLDVAMDTEAMIDSRLEYVDEYDTAQEFGTFIKRELWWDRKSCECVKVGTGDPSSLPNGKDVKYVAEYVLE